MIQRYKYPRTPHLPWSSGSVSEDDLVLQSIAQFNNKNVVVTEKLDGENTNMYCDYLHARSIHYRHHPSRDWIKKLHSKISHLIPPGWRLCGENLYAQHSIAYNELESYFFLFSIWNDDNFCLDWQQTMEWAELLGLQTPTEFYRGVWNESLIKNLPINADRCEGYVVRTIEGFSYELFSGNVAKWVRRGHVTTHFSWIHQEVIPNRLKKQGC